MTLLSHTSKTRPLPEWPTVEEKKAQPASAAAIISSYSREQASERADAERCVIDRLRAFRRNMTCVSPIDQAAPRWRSRFVSVLPF